MTTTTINSNKENPASFVSFFWRGQIEDSIFFIRINIAIKKRADNQEVHPLLTLSNSPPHAIVMLIALSPLIGSFMALLADRLPRGEDVSVKRSYCRVCETSLGVADLVPLFSYIFSRGKCRHCAAKIPWHLPVTEFGAVIIALIAVWTTTTDLMMILQAIFMWLLLGLFVADIRFFRLPDLLNFAALSVAILVIFYNPDRDLGAHLITGIVASATFWLIRVGYQHIRGEQGLGLGDVKLVAGLGVITGPIGLPIVILNAALLAIAYAFIRSLITKQSLSGKIALPFGSFLCLSAAVFWIIVGF
jgi:leader peptidase (prepilin peptidase)/N-methyltransferase